MNDKSINDQHIDLSGAGGVSLGTPEPPRHDHKIVLNVEDGGQWFGPNRVLYDIDLKVVQGQFLALVGASGCGKTTLLKAILGTDPLKAGKVETDGIEVCGPNRHVGIVYQKYGLYPFLTATENVAFGLMLDQTNMPERFLMPWKFWPKKRRYLLQAREILERLNLGHVLDSYPSQLSGGQAQRVAICQCLVMKHKVLLLDEPFGALDEATREKCQNLLLTLYEENMSAARRGEDPPHTVVIVTHELKEAFLVADRVVGFSRNWFESVEGSRRTGATLGATKVWDKAAPVYHPDHPKDLDLFFDLQQQLKEVVLNPQAPCIERNEHVEFWDDLERGVGTGVAITRKNLK